MHDLAFTADERRVLRRLSTPSKVQDFMNAMPFNFEREGDTCRSPRMVLRHGSAQCMEGAMFAAAALRFHGHPPLIIDFEAIRPDFDHVVAAFRRDGFWGAVSKTNHGVLRYREPVYRSVRELAMSYFHEYFWKDGRKTLRTYSAPVNLARFDRRNWMTSEEPVWFVPDYLCSSRHLPVATPAQIRAFRRADPTELRMVTVTEWPEPKKRR